MFAGVAHQQLGRFGTIITSDTVVPMDKVLLVACGTLTNRFARIAEGMAALNLWKPPGRVLAVFEHSHRLAKHLEEHFNGVGINVVPHALRIEGCHMPKGVADPFLEMADFVANTIGKNVRFQLKHGRTGCTDNFQALFPNVGPPSPITLN